MMVRANAVVGADGVAVVQVTPTTNQTWTISHMTIEMVPPSPVQPQAIVRLEQSLICGSNQGNGDTADGAVIVVAAGQALTVTWTGAAPGAIATLMLLYT